jgi:hypothetical protein
MEEGSEMLRLEQSFYHAETLDTSKSTSEILGKFRNMVLEKDGEGQLDRSREK